MSNNINIGAKISGRFKFQVVENGKVVEDRPWDDNMILNQGLDQCCHNAVSVFPSLFFYHAIGTGSAAVLATDIGLGNESKRTGTHLSGVGNNGRSNVGNIVTYRYTYDHTVEVSNVNYTEHGLSYTATPGNNLFSRALISGGTLTVLSGQQARCVYDITVTITPAVSTAITVGGTGWPVAGVTNCTGNYIIGAIDNALGSLSTSGAVGGQAFMIGKTTGSITGYALSAITLPSFNSEPSHTTIGSAISYTKDAYVAGTFVFTMRPNAYVSATEWNSTNINGWAFGAPGYGLYFKYTYAQTKADTHRLRYPSFTVTWARA